MERQKYWGNGDWSVGSGIVGGQSQPELGLCGDAKQKSGATKQMPKRKQKCLLRRRDTGLGCSSCSAVFASF